MHISIFENLQLEGLYIGDLLYLGLFLWAVRPDSCVYSVPLTHLHDTEFYTRSWGKEQWTEKVSPLTCWLVIASVFWLWSCYFHSNHVVFLSPGGTENRTEQNWTQWFWQTSQHANGNKSPGTFLRQTKDLKEITIFNRTQNPQVQIKKTTCYKQRKIVKLAVFFFFN